MIALAEPDATLTPALLSPEIQASRRTIPATDAPAEPEIRMRLDQPLPVAVEALEQTMVRHALERSHGRVEEAARLLGISRKGLFLKRRRWGLQQASWRSTPQRLPSSCAALRVPQHLLRLLVVPDDVGGRPLADLVEVDRAADDRVRDAHDRRRARA